MVGGEAEKAGLRKWDKILEINSTSVNNLDNSAVTSLFTNALVPGKKELQLLVQTPNSIYKDKKKELVIHYGAGGTSLIRIPRSNHGGSFGFVFGTSLTPIHSVSGVEAGGVAQSGGLEVGERILEINDTDVTCVSHKELVQTIKASENVLRLKLTPSGPTLKRV